ncbi:hypothetical protein AT746_04410 [Lacimicrobium alkaliphilum]|uniref:histidine kinase n=1 Tax=Lacimicrobium alkaliphilum TaxID=1526571 RepID=A0A0U3AFW1_9ALTE|nr:hypothetical protein AT746_04410 [Lacimicrobium alkaliphilum]
MSLGQPDQKLRTSVWRFTLLFTLLVLLITSSLLVLVYHYTIGEQERQKARQVEMTMQSLIELAQTPQMNESGFIGVIESRINKSASVVLALEVDGEYVGNLGRVPDNLSTFPELNYFPIAVVDPDGQTSIAMVLGAELSSPFGNLVVGVIDENYMTRDIAFFTISGVGLLACLLITTVAGFLFNRSVLSRVRQIAQLSMDVQAGNREARLPLSKRNDEFNAIAYQINSMLDEIDELIDSVAQVTDNIAHDLRTPLTRIRISLEDNLNDTENDTAQRKWKDELIESLDDVMATFNAMLELSRLEKGVEQGQFEPTDITQICADAIDLASALAEEKGQRLTCHFSENEDRPIVQGERSLLFRAVFNVLENAIKYSPQKSTISLHIENHEKACEIVIRDNGPGIPAELHERVFQRLYRVDSSRHSKGYGLGLSIVKAALNLHNGHVNLDSGEQGLTVRLFLPRQ